MAENLGYQGDIVPSAAWAMLEKEPQAQLIDCRTDAEWRYVGIPDLSALRKRVVFVPWQIYPHMQQNSAFAEQLREHVGATETLLFICRSGGRSRMAAIAMQAQGFSQCYNVEHGFEGDRDDKGQRARRNGWKYDKLPWLQD
ncbi:MAG: rhodanese-like domain-containing protein [Alphaproteobacteria bacterium GM202ARS2]|nr:rhodanese-like domain-containing protein [Alphaproteobacteria bacterium GM202ARS2]